MAGWLGEKIGGTWLNTPVVDKRKTAEELELGSAAGHVVERDEAKARDKRNGTGRPW
jgi:hypothetical protein